MLCHRQNHDKKKATIVSQGCVFMNNVLGFLTKERLGMKCVIKNTIIVGLAK